jgi:hypothetical protein
MLAQQDEGVLAGRLPVLRLVEITRQEVRHAGVAGGAAQPLQQPLFTQGDVQQRRVGGAPPRRKLRPGQPLGGGLQQPRLAQPQARAGGAQCGPGRALCRGRAGADKGGGVGGGLGGGGLGGGGPRGERRERVLQRGGGRAGEQRPQQGAGV